MEALESLNKIKKHYLQVSNEYYSLEFTQTMATANPKSQSYSVATMH